MDLVARLIDEAIAFNHCPGIAAFYIAKAVAVTEYR